MLNNQGKMMDKEQVRAAFEEWARAHNIELTLEVNHRGYHYPAAKAAWAAWQAALAAVQSAAQEPVAVFEGYVDNMPTIAFKDGQSVPAGTPLYVAPGAPREAQESSAALPDPDALQGDLFYMQDSRSYVGNDVLWWAKDGKGYTTDLSKAAAYEREMAVRMHEARISDIPWPKAYIDARTRPAVDMQYIRRDEALAGTGIELRKPPRYRKEAAKCQNCGSFMSEAQLWSGACPKCGADNRP